MDTRDIQIIKKGNIIAICVIISIVLVSTGLVFFEEKKVLLFFFGILLIGFCGFLLFFIPKGQRIEFTKYGMQFYSYGGHNQCRTYFWDQIKKVSIKDIVENNTEIKKVIIQLYTSGSNNERSEGYIEKTIETEVYGYSPEELKEIIDIKISPPNITTDKKQRV